MRLPPGVPFQDFCTRALRAIGFSGVGFFFFWGGGGLGSWGFRVSAFGFIVKGCRAQGGAGQPRPLDSSLLFVAASLPYKMKRNLTKPLLKNSPKP